MTAGETHRRSNFMLLCSDIAEIQVVLRLIDYLK